MRRIIYCYVLILLCLYGFSAYVSSQGLLETNTDKVENKWHLLGGFGASHPGWGETKEEVNTIDIILRQERPQEKIRGSDWYKHRRSLFVEVPLHFVTKPDDSLMVGVYFHAAWTFIVDKKIQPYMFIGGGPVYTKASIPGTSSEFKGSYQA